MISSPSISVVIPVFNGAGSLKELTSRLIAVLENTTYEIIFVDDDSPDNSFEIIRELCRDNFNLKALRFESNRGQHQALLAGILHAQNEIIITIDDDLQNPPEDIPKLIEALSDADLAYGTFEIRYETSARKYLTNFVRVLLKLISKNEIAMRGTSFRAFDKILISNLNNKFFKLVSLDFLLSKTASKVAFVPTVFSQKLSKTNYTKFKLIKHAIAMIFAEIMRPLPKPVWRILEKINL
jgi:glycosyltransferase involved in cell wall biosynthesis